jgi:cytoplasmic iron level regulating protein YaaA (DUF328/UPF0246 family)
MPYFYPMKDPLILLSPSKGMSSGCHFTSDIANACLFPKTTIEVVKAVQQLATGTAKKLFKVSDSMWPVVAQMWSGKPSSYTNPDHGLRGLTAYNGEAFKFLNAAELTTSGMSNAAQSLYILSAVYGAVSSNMCIAPYRLEMQSRLSVAEHKNLYSLWRPILTHWINTIDPPFVIDACSGEYSKAIDWKNIKRPFVQVDFKQLKNGQIKSVSAFSKQARGAFVRWCLENNIKEMSSLTSFSEMGYRMHTFDDNKLVFLRDSQ